MLEWVAISFSRDIGAHLQVCVCVTLFTYIKEEGLKWRSTAADTDDA